MARLTRPGIRLEVVMDQSVYVKQSIKSLATEGVLGAVLCSLTILLFLGLATRIATIPLLGTIAVIQIFVYPNAYNDHLVWGSILALVLTRGPGVFSLDYLIERAVRRRQATR